LTFVITDACIGVKDRSCVDVCPVDCIHDEEDADFKLYIDPDECIDCGACEPACPVTAIFSEDDVPADQKVYVEIDALWYKDKAAARARVKEVKPDAALPA
jgi:NAD-dependent dihydropyrimidine dehydrogenase PreA subunit